MSWTLPYFDYLVTYGGISHIGRVRENNEDAWNVDSGYGVFAVADGVGALLREIADAVDAARAPEVDDGAWLTVETAAAANPVNQARAEALLGQLRAAFRLAATPAVETKKAPARMRTTGW